MSATENQSSQQTRNAVALVTGGTTGIGLSTCKQLAARGGIDVIFTSRTEAKGKQATAQIKAEAKDKTVQVRFVTMELSDLSSVSKACSKIIEEEPYLDYLLLNAGLMGNPHQKQPEYSADGMEKIVAVNHIAGYYLAHRLLPLMEKTADESLVNNRTRPMITFVSSDLHNIHSPTGAAKKAVKPPVEDSIVRFLASQGKAGLDASASLQITDRKDPNYIPYNGMWSYKFSKLLNVLTARAMHEKLQFNSSKVGCNSMEPGFIPQSDLSREVKEMMGPTIAKVFVTLLYHGPINWLISWYLGQPVRKIEEGGYSEVYACLEGSSGIYYRLDKPDPPSPLADEQEVVKSFYEATKDFLEEKGFSTNKYL